MKSARSVWNCFRVTGQISAKTDIEVEPVVSINGHVNGFVGVYGNFWDPAHGPSWTNDYIYLILTLANPDGHLNVESSIWV